MKAYFTYFKMRLIHSLQYRTAAIAGVATQFFWGFMEIQLYRAFYQEHAEVFPMTLPSLVSYIWLRQAFLALFNTWTFENELFRSILDGNVAYELLRPTDLYFMWFSRTAALRISKTLLRFWPILLVAFLLPDPIGMSLPGSFGVFCLFVLSSALTLGVTVAFTLIVYFSCFYTLSSDGLRAILTPVSDLLAGGLLPIPFMPAFFQKIIKFSPFGSMLNAPLRIYSGNISGAETVETMLLQLFWLIALMCAGMVLQRKGVKKLSVQGG
ncbi:MAG: ABC transporter permease [Clostridia bacterium]|nr:ABC transporter permease [Clostridia bacterium]MBQ4620389.1 ABC transporter permease [Clostridia bacterium]MBQ9856836.1 ABC transporter permease [Clostridia bacterium]